MKTHAKLFDLLVVGILVFTLNSCNEDSQKLVEKPEKAISVERARELQKTYLATRARILNAGLGYQDTREFWFSVEELEQYLAYVKQEGKKLGHREMGIRIYFAAYPERDAQGRNYSTVFLAPTAKKDGTQKGEFFDFQAGRHQNEYGISALNKTHGGLPPESY